MHDGSVFFTIFIIFSGAAFLSTLVLYTKQSLLVAYILLGAVLGPWGVKLVPDVTTVQQVGDIGIVFLLFLLGLHLQPQNLIHMLKKVTWIALVSSFIFAATGFFYRYMVWPFQYRVMCSRSINDVFEYYYWFEIITYDYFTSPAYG